MCANAEKTIVEVIGGILTTANILGTDFNLTTNPDFQKGIAFLQQAETDVQSWKPGTPAQEIIQILNDAAQALAIVKDLIPVPALTLLQTILAGVAGVIGTLTGNGEVPAGTTAAAHASDTALATLQTVKAIQPAFHYKQGFLHEFRAAPAEQYHDFWNEQCDVAGYPDMKVK